MKQCVPVVAEEYEGELRFSIIEQNITSDCCSLVLGAKDEEELIGFKIEIPVVTRRVGFKLVQFVASSGVVTFSSIGEKSDRFIGTLVKYFKPTYDVESAFTEDAVDVDFVFRNQGADLRNDKIYLQLVYDEEQNEGLPKEERVHLKLNFSFNLSRELAGLAEVEKGYSADLVAFLMK